MRPLTPKSLACSFAENGYNPSSRWKTTAQPELNCTTEDYIELANASLEDARKQMTDFAEDYGYSYIQLEQKDLFEYETGQEPDFRKWLEEKCKETNQEPKSDLLIVNSCVKDLNRSQKKALSKGKNPDRVIDYQRGMYVVLKHHNNPKDTKSLNTLARIINDIEHDQRSHAHKNLFWSPHPETGFRAHKTLRTATVPEDNKDYAGAQVLTEIKIQHESQMGIDRATRPFLNISRNADRVIDEYNYCAVRDLSDDRFTSYHEKGKHAKRARTTSLTVAGWSRSLYNRVNQDSGLNGFLNPNLSEDQLKAVQAPAFKEIIRDIKETRTASRGAPKGITKRVLTAIAQSGILPPQQSQELKNKLDEKWAVHIT